MKKNSTKKDSKKLLFDESDEEETKLELKTNEKYAKSYNEFRKKELLQKLKDRGEESESSSSEDLSTDEEVDNPEFDKEFLKSYAYLVKKDEEKYKKKPEFFSTLKPVEEFIREKHEKKEKTKPVTIKDYKREMLLKHGADFVEEDQSDVERPASPSYMEEQKRLKESFKKAMQDNDDSDDDLLVKREKTKEETEKEQEDYLKWLAGQKEEAPEDAKDLEPLKDFWNSKELSKDDLFLRDYILNQRYLSKDAVPSYEEIVGEVEEDEKEFERQEEFEYKYNYRFEDPDPDFLKRYPRTIPDSVRAVDNKRKEKRKERKERKELEKLQKRKEFDELNKLKRQELEEKLQKLKEVAQNEKFNLRDEDLESEFDPDEHDRRMREAFNDEYYMIDEGDDQKPEFPDLDEEFEIEDYDNFDLGKKGNNDDEAAGHCEDDDFIMDADYDPEQAKREKELRLQEELIDSTRSKRKRKKRASKLAEIIKTEKPVFDPNEKSYEEYLDEYYKLDYEDVIGDTPCRFKYTETVPNDFGLTIEEILMATNKELNQWASLKKTMQIRPKQAELSDYHTYKKKGQNMELKRKIFKSIYGVQEDEKLDENIEKQLKPEEKEEEKVQEKPQNPEKRKKKKKKQAQVEAPNEETAPPKVEEPSPKEPKNEPSEPTPEPKKKKQKPNPTSPAPSTIKKPTKPETNGKLSNQKPPQKKKNFKNQQKEKPKSHEKVMKPFKKSFKAKDKQRQQKTELSDARLRAFGINPKRYHNKLKYGPNAAKKR